MFEKLETWYIWVSETCANFKNLLERNKENSYLKNRNQEFLAQIKELKDEKKFNWKLQWKSQDLKKEFDKYLLEKRQ